MQFLNEINDAFFSVSLSENQCQGPISIKNQRLHAATAPPAQPTRMPPTTNNEESSSGRKRTDPRSIVDASGTRYRARIAAYPTKSAASASTAPVPPWR